MLQIIMMRHISICNKLFVLEKDLMIIFHQVFFIATPVVLVNFFLEENV